ncbi:DUF6438 domain-containing protein [Flavobacterium saccharophilum]|uniref:Intein N-terminal splicing region n=1 Tax=Flavobacterium saccharophilum TaxID=29534 RepID=A0A1M7G2N0_9FLAO|nr:DUF6438 domain-containing protein [Flavobacterium saccharophilum]SHM10139.1 intein N-terminal splicing region [Flavobacterium saccharophilum]
MTKYLKFIIISFFFLISCKKNTKDYDTKIIGDWQLIENQKMQYDEQGHPLPPPPLWYLGNLKPGYSFKENDIYDNKLGFYKRIKKTKTHGSYNFFLGNKSKYKIKNDSLKLFDLSSNTWDSYKISSITSDTLTILGSDAKPTQFLKKKYVIDNTANFDNVIISSSGCYGNCPVSSVLINKNGSIIYNGLFYTYPKGLYQSSFNPKLFTKIETDFQKTNWKKLNDRYIASHTDDETITITFIKNNKIIKTITDYGNESPTEFCWTYTPLRFFYQKLKLRKINHNRNYLNFRDITFEAKDQECALTDSESFYLMTFLLNAKENVFNFEKKYTIKYWSNDVYKYIFSDGQYFQFRLENGKQITLDLGYNFLEKNDLMQRFVKKGN